MPVGFALSRSQQRENYKMYQRNEVKLVELEAVEQKIEEVLQSFVEEERFMEMECQGVSFDEELNYQMVHIP